MFYKLPKAAGVSLAPYAYEPCIITELICGLLQFSLTGHFDFHFDFYLGS